jgi:hypothetical protein
VNSWWWVPIGLAAWFLVSLAVGLRLGPALKRSAEAREAIDRQFAKPDVHHQALWDRRDVPGNGERAATR